MKTVELYAQVRYAVQIEGLSHREAARRYGIDPKTVSKMHERGFRNCISIRASATTRRFLLGWPAGGQQTSD